MEHNYPGQRRCLPVTDAGNNSNALARDNSNAVTRCTDTDAVSDAGDTDTDSNADSNSSADPNADSDADPNTASHADAVTNAALTSGQPFHSHASGDRRQSWHRWLHHHGKQFENGAPASHWTFVDRFRCSGRGSVG
jgi:hypothetical protein